MKIIGYKLIQDLPDTPKGTISHKIINDEVYFKSELILSDFSDSNIFTLDFCSKKIEWFEPVYETPQIPKGSDAERFMEMVECKQKYTKDIVCGRITFSFDFLTTDRVDIHFDENGSFKRINTIS
jgi:hypothetical protein